MRLFALIAGLALSFSEVLLDAFQTIILPPPPGDRTAAHFRLFMTTTWIPWRGLASRTKNTRRRESFLSSAARSRY